MGCAPSKAAVEVPKKIVKGPAAPATGKAATAAPAVLPETKVAKDDKETSAGLAAKPRDVDGEQKWDGEEHKSSPTKPQTKIDLPGSAGYINNTPQRAGAANEGAPLNSLPTVNQ